LIIERVRLTKEVVCVTARCSASMATIPLVSTARAEKEAEARRCYEAGCSASRVEDHAARSAPGHRLGQHPARFGQGCGRR
jgi:hypothetical protein